MSDCLSQPSVETVAALAAQVHRLTRQVESLTRQVHVLTERQRETAELERVIRRARFAAYADAPHRRELPRRHLRAVGK